MLTLAGTMRAWRVSIRVEFERAPKRMRAAEVEGPHLEQAASLAPQWGRIEVRGRHKPALPPVQSLAWIRRV